MTTDTSPEPPKGTPPFMRSVVLSAAILIALLVGAEAALRTDFVFTRLPMPRPYYSSDVTRRLHKLELLERGHGTIDVLFVGSSVVRAALQPRTFNQEIEKLTGKRILSFNGGFSKMYPAGARLYLERVWLEHTKPRFVFHGVRPNELSSRGTPSYLKHGLIESLWFDKTNKLAMLEARVLDKSKLLQYRGTLNTVLSRWSKGQPLHLARESDEMTTDNRGYRKEPGTLASKRRGKSNRLWKYGRPIKADQYDRSLAAMEAMLELCREAGAEYVVVNMPEHPDRYDHKYAPPIWSDYQRVIQAWAKQRGVPYIDLTRGDYNTFADDKLYVDYHHLSPRGAKLLTELLANDVAKLVTK